VSFDERGDSKGRYNIMNYRRNRATRRYEYVTVGRWADRLSMDVVDYGINRITWAGGTAPTSGGLKERKEKERKSIYIAPFCTKAHTKRSGMDHRVLPANNTMPAFPSWRSPDVATTATEAADIHLQAAAHYSFIDPERMKG